MLFQAHINRVLYTRVSSMSLCFPSLPFGICWLAASLPVPKVLWLSRLSGVLLATAVFLASYHEPLLDANTTTNIVNSFHSAPLRLSFRYGSLLCIFFIRRFAVFGSTGGGTDHFDLRDFLPKSNLPFAFTYHFIPSLPWCIASCLNYGGAGYGMDI